MNSEKQIELQNRVLGCEQAILKLSAGLGRLGTACRGLLAAVEELTKLEAARSGGGTKIKIDLN